MARQRLYQAEVTIYATAYIKAPSAKAARKLWRELDGEMFEIGDATQTFNNVVFSGLRYDNPELPKVSLSPAMTVSIDANLDVEASDD